MADVTNELVYEVLKQIQERLGDLDHKLGEVKQELQAIRTHLTGQGQDIQNIYSILARHDVRLDRIERRLELNEMSTP